MLAGGCSRYYNNSYNMETFYITKIIKVGNSYGIIIPQEILNGFHWQRGDHLIFGFGGTEQIFLKRLTDKDMEKLKPYDPDRLL